MAKKLYFRYGAMNSGKSTSLLQAAYNYEERGQKVVIGKPTTDTKDDKVLSRLGVAREVDFPIAPDTDVYEEFSKMLEASVAAGKAIDCLIVDEAQFLETVQIDGLFMIAVKLNVPVLAYGIRTDFQTKAFTGSLRLLELAHSLEELKTICRCGSKAMFNGRLINGEYVRTGDQVAIDGQQATYESLCGPCYLEKVGPLSHGASE